MNEIETEFEIVVKAKYHYTPIIPAKIDGPPEFCYPEEGGELEWEITNWDEIHEIVEDEIKDRIEYEIQCLVGRGKTHFSYGG